MRSGTCKSYVAAVRSRNLENGMALGCEGPQGRLQAVLKGVQRHEAGVAKRVRRLITPAVLKNAASLVCGCVRG